MDLIWFLGLFRRLVGDLVLMLRFCLQWLSILLIGVELGISLGGLDMKLIRGGWFLSSGIFRSKVLQCTSGISKVEGLKLKKEASFRK